MAKKYKLTKTGVQDLETSAFIPNDHLNREWRKYQEWKNVKGNTPDPIENASEKTAREDREKRDIESAIIDMRIRKDAAIAEGLTDYATQCDNELKSLRNKLK